MSRRQSRVSIDARQNDTLLEFENFKKKFLLANKHITKLNSTLSARIEELNAQISTLYVENLRLRASEIALTSQLKKEREKSRKILADTESATHTLMKQLGLIRKSFSVPHGRSSTPEANPPPPRAKRPIPDPNVSPPPNRIARPPTIPVLVEDEEPNMSSPEDPEDVEPESSPPPRKRKTKPRSSSSSRLPVPLSKSPPPAVDVIQFDFDDKLGKSGKRRPTRRQSGLLTSLSITAVTTDGINRPSSPVPGSPVRDALEEEEIAAAEPDEDEVEVILQTMAKRERKAKRDKESERAREAESDVASDPIRPRERKKHRSTEESVDVPEVPKFKLKDVTNSHPRRSVLSLDTASDRERQPISDGDMPTSATSLLSTSTRAFLSTPATTPAPPSKLSSHLPTPRSSSPVEPPPQPESEAGGGGRERRVRKSVNYAEPKLNTKMRKPDPAPPATTTATSKRSSVSVPPDDVPILSARSSSSNGADADVDPVPTGTARRKKSRAYVAPEDEDESEGTQADAEFGSLRTGTWTNIDGRRRSVHASSSRRVEGDDIRRHSLAV